MGPQGDYERDLDAKGIQGAYGVNLWDNKDWLETLPKPDPNFDVAHCFRDKLGDALAPQELTPAVSASAAALFDTAVAAAELTALYSAYQSSQESKQYGS